MSESIARNVLLIGVSQEEADRVAPFLGRSGFGVDRFPSASGALELLGQIAFDLLIVRFPLSEINVLEVLQAVRRQDSACLHSPLILLAAGEEHRLEAGFYVGFGANRVLGVDDSSEQIQAVISELLVIAPRVDVRVPVSLEVKVGDDLDTVSTETRNLSRSGMLIGADTPLSLGDRAVFDLLLPGDDTPIRGTFEVVRQSIPDRGDAGTGVRFIEVAYDGSERLDAFLDGIGC